MMEILEPLSHAEAILKSLNLLEFCNIINYEILALVFHLMTPHVFLTKQIFSFHSYATCQSVI